MTPIVALLVSVLLTGCATFEAGPRRVAENTCSFVFLASIPVAGPIIGPLLCSFGLDEIPEDEEDVDV